MKFLYLKSKKVALIAMILIAAASNFTYANTDDYTDSIESICAYFDNNIIQKFEQTLKVSFSETSTEKLNITAKKLEITHAVIKQFIDTLEVKAGQLKSEAKTDTNLYKFIDILLQMAADLEIYFNKTYSTLTSALAQKLKAAAFAQKLSKVIETIITDQNFNKIDESLKKLRVIAPTNVTTKIDEIRSDVSKILAEYKKNRAKQNAAAISMLRKRLPY